MFDAVGGRFLSADPIGIDSGDLNLYRYCKNDPIDNIDPSGLTIEFQDKDDAEQFAKLLRDDYKAMHVKVEESTIEGETTYHVYTTLQDADAVFRYADRFFTKHYNEPQTGKPFFLPEGEDKNAIEEAKRRAAFLKALMIDPLFSFSDKDGDEEAAGAGYTVELRNQIFNDVREALKKLTIKVDHGGEGRGNKDRINFNVCGRGTMQTTAGKPIPRLIPKTEATEPTPFLKSTVDEVWFVAFAVRGNVFDSAVLDAARILKLKGKIVIEGPNDRARMLEAAVKLLLANGYQISSSYDSVTDPDYPTIPTSRGTIIIEAKPMK